MRQRGRLTEWNDERGFGFVTSLDGESRAFVHISAFPHDLRRPKSLDLLTYETGHDDRGRLQATTVEFLAPVPGRRASAHGASPPQSGLDEIPMWLPLGMLVAILLGAIVFRGELALLLLTGYFVMSVVTYIAYAADKSAAAAGRFRTQESALHLLELVGGWPGALIAQHGLRHKTKKQSYQLGFWICVTMNLAALILVLYSAAPG